jgi:glucose-6-phosphate isomerase
MTSNTYPALVASPAWKALAGHAASMRGRSIASLFADDPQRMQRFAVDAAGLHLDCSKHLADAQTLDLLERLAEQQRVAEWRDRMFAGDAINTTEQRAVLHVALRMPRDAARTEVRETRDRMRAFVDEVRGDPGIDAVVNLGIGGSDLGPRMATHALRGYSAPRPLVRFVANADPADFAVATHGLDPARTLFIVASKTFTTVETMSNVRLARAWGGRRFAAVTANVPAAQALGVPPERVFPMWDWVGGRYSVWSAVGLPLAIAIGMDAFESFLAGANAMDEHFRTAPLKRNLPTLLALLGVWYVNFHDAQAHAVLPYSEDLRELPAYLQQLEMESNGKRVDRDGRMVDYATCPVIWGAAGTNGQHAFHQLLHQGTPVIPCDFIAAANPVAGEDAQAHRLLLANALAQSAALMAGKSDALPHKAFPGSRPSTTLVLERLAPATLGALLALYEHKVFVQGAVWGLNSFDQWGVELGKAIAGTLQPALDGGALPAGIDASTAALIARLRQN